jgi:hypothetical protein
VLAAMTDIDIIIEPRRPWASAHANTQDGLDWVRKRRLEIFDPRFLDEHLSAVRKAGLRVMVYEKQETAR